MEDSHAKQTTRALALLMGGAVLACGPANADEPEPLRWRTVVNHARLVPGTAEPFNSYNQPAVNERGLVVFRARSRGGNGQPATGIFTQDVARNGPVNAIYLRGGTVPQPNNALYNGALASFNEFPSVPRIDAGSDTIATRGQSRPVWVYTLDGVDTRTGTAGVYLNVKGARTTGASMLGDVPGFPHFQVPIPSIPAGTGFDQFPGAPAVTAGSVVAFKGNFTTGGIGLTGVFHRDVTADGGVAPIRLVASSFTRIPGVTPATLFGSTAPPSAAGRYIVFAGYDNEALPTAGGIYRHRLGNAPETLEKVVAIGEPVPGVPGQSFRAFGEAVSLSEDGERVLFWGTWGTATRTVNLNCPAEGNANVRAYCLSVTPPGTTREVPVNQGFFVRDMKRKVTLPVARTGEGIVDFLYWNFSGRVPGMGGGDSGEDIEEPARWRTATFGALSGDDEEGGAAFKTRNADGSDAIQLARLKKLQVRAPTTVVSTGMPASVLDTAAPVGAVVTSLGLERDGFRDEWLAITAGMLASDGTEESTWGGIYVARIK